MYVVLCGCVVAPYNVVSGLIGLSSPCLSPGPGNCVVFLSKTICSHSLFLLPGTNDEFIAGCNPEMDQHPIHGGVD